MAKIRTLCWKRNALLEAERLEKNYIRRRFYNNPILSIFHKFGLLTSGVLNTMCTVLIEALITISPSLGSNLT
ncbi:hypothetical protein [Paenibacillus macerans]|uniref:hypothetical protein n=1 Tax=Paenibacillus macerans TaxID=44252 RepID=UPI003D313F4A